MSEHHAFLEVSDEVAAAVEQGRPIVALESTVIAHGLPWPINLETAREIEAAVREAGAVPATIALLQGKACVGLHDAQLEQLARGKLVKASRRDLAAAIAQGQDAATTVSATMFLAHRAGIRLFATGGIGGVHRDAGRTFDVSADLIELARTPVCVVCAGVKAILDVAATLEMLETLAVPVIVYQTNMMPTFYVRDSDLPLESRVDTPQQAAELLTCHWKVGGAGVALAQPCPEEFALDRQEFEAALRIAEDEAREQGVKRKSLTPFLLSRLTELTGGKTLPVNRQLLVANARLAALVADTLGKKLPP
jgi:pseudouridylate synthase